LHKDVYSNHVAFIGARDFGKPGASFHRLSGKFPSPPVGGLVPSNAKKDTPSGRDLMNLALRERRLRNQRKTDIAELTQLQKDRVEREKELSKKRHNEVQRALELHNKASYHKVDLDLAGLGFDFSRDELLAYSQQNENQKRLTDRNLDFDQWLTAFRAAQKEQKAA
jgi:hypothetical protein